MKSYQMDELQDKMANGQWKIAKRIAKKYSWRTIVKALVAYKYDAIHAINTADRLKGYE